MNDLHEPDTSPSCARWWRRSREQASDSRRASTCPFVGVTNRTISRRGDKKWHEALAITLGFEDQPWDEQFRFTRNAGVSRGEPVAMSSQKTKNDWNDESTSEISVTLLPLSTEQTPSVLEMVQGPGAPRPYEQAPASRGPQGHRGAAAILQRAQRRQPTS
jgi:hypothetical protein